MGEIEEVLCSRIAKVSRIDAVSVVETAELVHELGMSSLELLDLLAFAEQRYGVSIPDHELSTLTTVRRIAKKVRELGTERGVEHR